MTDKDYNIISKKAYSLDPKEYKAEEQYSVGKEFDVNARNIESLMLLGTLLNQRKTACKQWLLLLLTIKGT